MIFWPIYIGSWQSATRHLTAEERGVYLELLNFYYSKETRLPADHDKLCRIASATAKGEREAVAKIISEFFTLDGETYFHGRADDEIAKFRVKSGKQSAKAELRWRLQREREAKAAGMNGKHALSMERFDEFYSIYPRKVSRAKAEREWAKLDTESKSLAIANLPSHLKQEQWARDGGKFIPHPDQWLKHRRWEDQVTAAPKEVWSP